MRADGVRATFSAIALVVIILLALDQGRWHRLSRTQSIAVFGLAMALLIVGVLRST
jgi:integral membrane sensor domain MASE1